MTHATERRAARDTAAPWWAGEDHVRLSDLPRMLPALPGTGQLVSLASIYRWTTAGLRGVRLRRFRCAGSWATTAQELVRWQAAMTAAAGAE